jgi:type I restriction enzyme, S subunit
MATEWEAEPLDNLVDDILDRRGLTPTKLGSAFSTSGHRVLSAKLIKDHRIDITADEPRFVDDETYRKWMRTPIYPDDVILTSEAPLGELAYIKEQLDWCLGQRLFGIRTRKDRLHGRYLFYALQSSGVRSDLLSRATGTTAQGIRQSELRLVTIPVPPVAEQKAIAAVLGAMDDKIELKRRINETLETIALAIFKSWFVDATQVGLPTGWHQERLSELTGFLGGYAFKSKDWVEQGVPVVKIGSVKPGIVDLNEVSFVSDEVAKDAKRFRLSPGDLIIGMTGYVGEVGLVPLSDNPPLLNQRVGKFLLKEPGTSELGFLYCLTRRPEFKAQVEAKSHGTAQANVSAEGILSIPVIVPPKTLQETFNQMCQPMLDQILANHAESSALAALRDALLPKLLSGDLRILPSKK